ncbi:hypothetical protein HD599_001098 [Conyzicola lurida]|uniref:NERD domain-containing protein n=1 Tax=Conyzicola lurida TaxID=1172621 RepID=A0A841AMM0_9MICO|nr:nuclease-related domain-containing protein [Conyzicola lurida]MBB5842775.1 hypothetical protein [Conyzicola lurida]
MTEVAGVMRQQAMPAVVPEPTVPVHSELTLRTRIPAYSVMDECLRRQAEAAPRGAVARFFGRDPLHPDAVSWYRGTLGELEVARVLARLDPAWVVLHAVPVGSSGADIDHIVIGPGGTFTINTKNHGGKKIWASGNGFMVDGQKQSHIRNSLFEAERASDLLSAGAGFPVAVTPVLVVVRPQSIASTTPAVVVMASTDLFRWLKRRPRMQTAEAIRQIAAAAEQRSTWCTGQPRTPTTEQALAAANAQRFAALRADVDVAHARRQGWSLVGASLFLAVVVGAALALLPFVPAILAAMMAS